MRFIGGDHADRIVALPRQDKNDIETLQRGLRSATWTVKVP